MGSEEIKTIRIDVEPTQLLGSSVELQPATETTPESELQAGAEQASQVGSIVIKLVQRRPWHKRPRALMAGAAIVVAGGLSGSIWGLKALDAVGHRVGTAAEQAGQQRFEKTRILERTAHQFENDLVTRTLSSLDRKKLNARVAEFDKLYHTHITTDEAIELANLMLTGQAGNVPNSLSQSIERLALNSQHK